MSVDNRTALLSWRPRLTARARLTLTYASLLVATGAIMLTIIYTFMRYVPSYNLMGASTLPAATLQAVPTDVANLTPLSTGTASPITITSESDVLNTLLLTSLIAIVVLAVIGAWVGWIMAGRILRPLQRINRAAQLAGSGSLTHRVGLVGPRDEFTELSDTFDAMLERLHTSFEAQQRFAANASHELRTPLATSKTMLDVALADRDPADLRQLAERLRETNQRSIETVEALLDLSAIGQDAIVLSPVPLHEVTAEAVGAVQAEALEHRLTVTTRLDPALASGDATLLRQVALNLLHNAVRHNHDGGAISVGTRVEEESVVLVVVNTGDTVSEEDVPLLTEAFYRGAGRLAPTAGTVRSRGLGLAIVASIVEAHAGTIVLTPNPRGGLTATVTLPR